MFQDGHDFDEVFQTAQGNIRVFAEVRVGGSHLTLNELLFFPDNGEDEVVLGVKQVLEIFQTIRAMAKDSGFTKLTAIYHRVGEKRDGRIITRTRSLL